jgi:hypothetical protein
MGNRPPRRLLQQPVKVDSQQSRIRQSRGFTQSVALLRGLQEGGAFLVRSGRCFSILAPLLDLPSFVDPRQLPGFGR